LSRRRRSLHESQTTSRSNHRPAPGRRRKKIGGIIIPDSAKEKPQQGKILAVGDGKVTEDGKRIAMDVRAGEVILFGKYSGQDIKIDDEDYLIVKEDEVLAVIDTDATRQETKS